MKEAHSLQQHLQRIIPSARLEVSPLPDCPAMQLWLLNADYPQGNLSAQEVQRAMDNPLYWVFCWASGQVLARYLLSNPQWVKGKRVLDFGCGSGVVAVAAALAGAAEVIACDIDPLARSATLLNARLNGVSVAVAEDYDAVTGEIDLIIVADVLYDRANLVWLQRFTQRAARVLVADSRVKDFDHPPYRQIDCRRSFTVPDLAESAEYGEVKIYLAE